VFEASYPPYHPTKDPAVDAVFSRTPREATAPVPHRMSNEDHRAGTVRVSAEGLACTKAVCSYIYDTYGRFPGTSDAMHLMWVMQVLHIDTDYERPLLRRRRLWPDARGHTWRPGIDKT